MYSAEKKRFKVSRWIFLSLAALTNTFLILYSTLPQEITLKWNKFFADIFASFVNSITEKEIKVVPLSEIKTYLSLKDSYSANYIPGYNNDEIPLGSAKQVETSFLPADATDKTVFYSTEQNEIVSLYQGSTTVSVVGMKTGIATIKSTNKATGLQSSCDVKVVDTVAPVSFTISVDESEIKIGSQETINFDIDGGSLGHDELINFRYYDIRKLEFTSSKEDIATVDNYGVIKPVSIGDTTITVKNPINNYSKSIDISIINGVVPIDYTNLSISGSDVCYEYDMIKDQSSKTNHYQLSIYDEGTILDPEDFIWESSNELLVKVDSHGVMRGFRKSISEDEFATITATSKITNQIAAFNVTVKEQLPEIMYYSITNNKKTTSMPVEYTACVGDKLVLNVSYNPVIINKRINSSVSDEGVINCANQGTSLVLFMLKEGSCTLNISSVANPSLTGTIQFKILKAGVISSDDLDDVGYSIRKIVGHASLFAIAEIFTIIATYMFVYNKKRKYVFAIAGSLLIEFFISSFSELVQHFSPDRKGKWSDVGINCAGAVIGAAIVVLIYVIVWAIRRKQKNHS